ncbi:MAG: histidinol-phosphatase [Phycisphaeraceae bacterium]|nr:histidinol-phosphatase [Phycisphaeraceae bacterium]
MRKSTSRVSSMTIILSLLLICVTSNLSLADPKRPLNFPDILGYKTLACDFHMHTVFSDGEVWPTVRVKEAWRDGLDAIAITDHIEYQPHKEDVSTNHNRAHDIVASLAREMNLLFPRGSEITRGTPPGHFNGIFLKDSALLETDKFLDAMKAASDQNAFIFWNHPDWKPKAMGWFEAHTTVFENGWLHGIEVANGGGYSENAHRWCLEKNLTMMGNSDIHAPESDQPYTPDQHRTLTLVLAKDKTMPALREALFARRTIVWCKDQLIGRKPLLEALLQACIKVEEPHLRRDNKEKETSTVWFEVANTSPVTFELKRTGRMGPTQVTLPARTVTLVRMTVPMEAYSVDMAYTVSNVLVAPGEGLPVQAVITLK